MSIPPPVPAFHPFEGNYLILLGPAGFILFALLLAVSNGVYEPISLLIPTSIFTTLYYFWHAKRETIISASEPDVGPEGMPLTGHIRINFYRREVKRRLTTRLGTVMKFWKEIELIVDVQFSEEALLAIRKDHLGPYVIAEERLAPYDRMDYPENRSDHTVQDFIGKPVIFRRDSHHELDPIQKNIIDRFRAIRDGILVAAERHVTSTASETVEL